MVIAFSYLGLVLGIAVTCLHRYLVRKWHHCRGCVCAVYDEVMEWPADLPKVEEHQFDLEWEWERQEREKRS